MTAISIEFNGIDNVTGMIDGIGGALDGLAGVAKGALVAGLGAATAAFGAMSVAIGIGIKEALDAEKVNARLAATLKSTGGAAGLTMEAAKELAAQFRDLAGGNDDLILSLEEIAIRAGSISAKEMPEFIQASLDLGVVLGDTAAAATLLARAEEDPIAAMGRLQRSGVLFNKTLEEQIKQLVKEGKAGEAASLVMQRVAEATGGQAAASMDTASGKMEIFKGHLLDAAENIGNSFLPILKSLFDDVILPALPTLESFGDLLSKNIGAAMFVLGPRFEELSTSVMNLLGTLGGLLGLDMSNFNFQAILTEGIGAIAEFLNTLNGLVDVFQNQLPGAVAGAKSAWDEFQTTIQPLVDALGNLGAAFIEQMPSMQAEGQKFTAWLIQAFGVIGPQVIANISSAVNALAEIWREHGDEIMAVITFIVELLVATLMGTVELMTGAIATELQLLQGDWQGAFETIVMTLEEFFNLALSIVGTNTEEFRKTWLGIFDLMGTIAKTGVENIIKTIQGFFENFKEVGTELARNIERGIVLYISQIINTVKGMMKSALDAAGGVLGNLTGGGSGGSKSSGGHKGGYASGGISSGPETGYLATLHGTEAVIPLPNGQDVPVEMRGGGITGTSNSTHIGSINIVIQGTDNPRATAEMVIRELQDRDLIAIT